MRVEVNRNASSQYYFPKAVAKVAGENAEVIPNAFCLVMFPKGSSPGKILRSLEIIQKDLEHQIVEEEIERQEKQAEPEKAQETSQPESLAGRVARLEKLIKKRE